MATSAKRTGSRNIEGATKRTTTKPEATGVVLEVSDPTDLWYLCEKVGFAQLNPFFRSDGLPMYQRVVTQLIRMDSRMFGYKFPYCGEVGYDMTQSPPAPIMSRKEPARPSEFPLSQYRVIKQQYDLKMSSPWLEVDKELLSLQELAEGLDPAGRSGRPQGLRNGEGLLRIPDVVRVENYKVGGKAQYTASNLLFVIEVKFDGDRLTPRQQEAYERIAGGKRKLRLLTSKSCDRRKSRTREWIRAASKEPVYVPVGQAMRTAARRRNGLPFVSESELLVGQIDREHAEVSRVLETEAVPAGTPTITAQPNADAQRRQREQNDLVRTHMGTVLAAPFVIAGTAVAAARAAILLGGAGAGAAEPTIAARAGAQVIQFPRILKPVAAGVAAASASYELAAQSSLDQIVSLQSLPTAYVYWPD